MADADLKHTNGVIGKIDIILGTEYDHILPMVDVVFGDEEAQKYSCFKSSKLGVLLSGNISNVTYNMIYSPI